ncbi:MAG: SMI1/KNR4 family protein [Clostridia bacterium]|nr:SMI1/KNR4 family protein [Clostridia bacterium]MBQ8419991.1 SMI1/KNR4 family protein [Clostridia bacterium]
MVKVNPAEKKFDAKRWAAFCARWGFSFPDAFISYLKRYNDGELEPNMLPLPDNGCMVRYFYGTSDDDCADMETVYGWYQERLPKNCVPIADPDFGNLICISLAADTYGKIYFWDHETMDAEEDEMCTLSLHDLIPVAESFEDLLKQIKDSPY